MECQFCKKSFSSKSAVTYHQKTAKYCLKIQGKDNADKEYICVCGKISNSKYHFDIHDKSCSVKDLIKTLKDKNKLYEEKIEQLEKNQDENLMFLKKIKELEMIIIEKDKIICTLNGSIDIYKEDHKAFVDIAKQPKTNTTTTNNHNKVLNIKTSIDFDDKSQIEHALSNYNLEYFLDGQRGVARFVVDNILKDEENNLKYLCTDASRSTFKYKDKLGNIQKDYEAKRLTNYLVEGGIKNKVIDISEKWITDDDRFDKNKLEIVLEKNNEVNEIDKNNQVFKKELASIVSL
jgi:hypothetical protein